MKPKILVITPVKHISGVASILEEVGGVTYLDDPSQEEVCEIVEDFDVIYTNPNKSKVYLGKAIFDVAKKLKVICTASTGTNHIDQPLATSLGIDVLSLTEEREVINRISSTAELAFSLTMTVLRNIIPSHAGALNGEWDYTKYIGRQMNCLTVGVVGYGRLGSLYANYCQAFGSRVLIYDPYKKVDDSRHEQVSSLEELATHSDIISIHVHVSDETFKLIGEAVLKLMKPDVLIVNSARGEIVDEEALVNFLSVNPMAKVATDVLADEVRNRLSSPLLRYAGESSQVVITQHIGGMTREAQEIAYGHAASRLRSYYL